MSTGGAANVTFSSARLGGTVNPQKTATNYYFQYGTTTALGIETAVTPVGAGNKGVRVSVDLAGLAPTTRYHYRIVAQNASGTTLGKRRTFTTRKQPLGVSLAASPNPVKLGTGTTLAGTLSGTGNAGRKIVLQSNPWPYTQGFLNASNELLTNSAGGFSFPILSLPFNTQYRVVMPERPAVASPIVTAGVKFYVGSKVNKKRVKRGKKIRFSGTIKPARPGANIAFQKKSNGRWVVDQRDGRPQRRQVLEEHQDQARRRLPRLDRRRRRPVHVQPRQDVPHPLVPLSHDRDAAPSPRGGAA